jgi:hypothetical protein
MKRRAFINEIRKGSLVAAITSMGKSGMTNGLAPLKLRETETSIDLQQQDPARLPKDLKKLAGNTSLKKPKDLTVVCYVFPNYHSTPLHDKLYGSGWTEYVLTRYARPWFEGHQQSRGSLLGELDERKPSTWEKYNQLANQHGVRLY